MGNVCVMKTLLSIFIFSVLPIGLVHGSVEAVEVCDGEERKGGINDEYFTADIGRGAAAAVKLPANDALFDSEEERITKLSFDELLIERDSLTHDIKELKRQLFYIEKDGYDIYPVYDYVIRYNPLSWWWQPEIIDQDLSIIYMIQNYHKDIKNEAPLEETLDQYRARFRKVIDDLWDTIKKEAFVRDDLLLNKFMPYYQKNIPQFAEYPPIEDTDESATPSETYQLHGDLSQFDGEQSIFEQPLSISKLESQVIRLRAEKESIELKLSKERKQPSFKLELDKINTYLKDNKILQRWDRIIKTFQFQIKEDLYDPRLSNDSQGFLASSLNIVGLDT